MKEKTPSRLGEHLQILSIAYRFTAISQNNWPVLQVRGNRNNPTAVAEPDADLAQLRPEALREKGT